MPVNLPFLLLFVSFCPLFRPIVPVKGAKRIASALFPPESTYWSLKCANLGRRTLQKFLLAQFQERADHEKKQNKQGKEFPKKHIGILISLNATIELFCTGDLILTFRNHTKLNYKIIKIPPELI